MEHADYKDTIMMAARRQRVLQHVVDCELLLPNVELDEVALLFPDGATLDRWLQWVRHDTLMNHFRTEEDTMQRRDNNTEFQVRFEFVQMVGALWRIEAMCVTSGVAQLHQDYWQEYASTMGGDPGPCVPVHVSYKCADSQAYDLALIELGHRRRKPGTLTPEAFYRNTYGAFSYWSHPALGRTYLKPRVNLRDAPGSDEAIA